MESKEEICKDEFYEGDNFETYSTIEVSKCLRSQIQEECTYFTNIYFLFYILTVISST